LPPLAVNLFDDFGVPLPAFAQNTPVDQIKQGDLIYNARKVMGWVVQCPAEGNVAFKLLKPDGTRGEWRPPKVASLGLDLSGAMVLRSLMNTLPDGGLGSMQNMLLPLMMFGDGDGLGDMENMLPLLLMSQCNLGGVSGEGANPMGNMFPMMMMMKMMGRGGSGGGSGDGGGGFFDR